MNTKIVIVTASILIVGAGSFYGGMSYSKTKSTGANFSNLTAAQRQTRLQQFSGSGSNVGARMNGGFVTGNIISNDGKSITVQLQNGGSKIIFYSGSTEISKFVIGASSDLIAGKTVSITGTANQDGSITAQTIQIRPNLPSPSPNSNQQ